MVEKKRSVFKGLLQGLVSFLATLVVMLTALPQEQAIYGSITVGIIVAILKTIIDAHKHWED